MHWFERGFLVCLLAVLAACSIPPDNPSNFTAQALDPTHVALAWAALPGAEYLLERKAGEVGSPEPFAQIAKPSTPSFTDTTNPNSTYTYRLKAKNTAGNSPGVQQTVTTPDLPPGVPTAFTASPLSPLGVKLSWAAPASGGEGTAYAPERGLGFNPSSYTPLYSGTSLSYSDNTAASNTGYTYRLKSSNASGASDWVGKTTTTLPAPIPGNPTNLKATAQASITVQLSWQAPTGVAATDYLVYRKEGGGEYIQIATTTSLSYSDTLLTPSTLYVYRVQSRNAYGSSTGAEASATTLAATLDAPRQFYATATLSSRVVLAWTAVTNASSFMLERRRVGEASYSPLGNLTVGHFSDAAITPDASYTYRIRALNASGSSNWKELLVATPDTNPAAYRILFIGNSRTGYNDVPGLVRQIALADGRQKPEIGSVILYGRTLEDQWKELLLGQSESQAVQAIKEGNWDVVVLQELSTRPVLQTDLFYQYMRQFVPLIRSSGALPLLFLNWRHLSYSFTQSDMNIANYKIADEQALAVAPVGIAWEASSTQYPGIQLFDSDGNHARLAGSYLAAAVIYASLYNRVPAAPAVGLDSTTQANLNAVAWQSETAQAAQYHLPGFGYLAAAKSKP